MPSLFEAYGLADLSEQPQDKKPETRGIGGVAKDVGISALKGAIAVPEAAVGALDLVSGGHVGRVLEDAGFRPAEAKAILDEQYSQEQKDAFARVQAAQGFGDTLYEAVTNPSVIGHSVIESLPSMGAGGVIARGGMALAPKVAPVLAGAFGEGAVQAGSAAEQARQESPDRLLSARGAGAAVLSGVLDTAIAAGSGGLAKRLGIADVDTLLAGAKTSPVVAKGLTRRVLEGMATEGLLEELPQSIQEQVLANYGAGKPLDEGVNQAAVLGMLSGAAMGGGANVLSAAPKVPENGPLSRAANQAQPAPAVAAAAGMPGAETVQPVNQPGGPTINAGGPQAEPQVDPVVERIKTMPAGDREEALAAYSMLSRDDLPKGVRQYNSRLLDDLLAKLDEKPAAEQSDPAALLSQGMERDPLQGALAERRNEEAAQANLAQWMARAQALPLQQAQEIQQAAAEQGRAWEVVPHSAGQGYTVVPAEWLTPSMRGQTAGAIPMDATPTGVLRADARGNVAPETGAQRIDARQAQAAADAERARKNALGLTPDVEAVQAGKKRTPLPTVQPGDVTLKSGEPFKNKGAAVRAQAKSGAGEVVQVQGGWVVRTPQQQLEAGDGGTGADGGVAAGTAGRGSGDAQRSEPAADAVGRDAGRADAVPAAEGGAVPDAGGEPAAAVAEAAPQFAVGDKVHVTGGLYFGSAGTVESISPTGRIVVRADNAMKSGLSVTAADITKGEKPAPQDAPEPAKPKQPNGSDAKKAKALFTKPSEQTAPNAARWQSSDAATREALLLSAGWKPASPGLSKMKAQAWDKMTQGQRTRIAKAMPAEAVAPAAAPAQNAPAEAEAAPATAAANQAATEDSAPNSTATASEVAPETRIEPVAGTGEGEKPEQARTAETPEEPAAPALEPEKEPVAADKTATKAAPSTIQDTGEKIGGARKDKWKERGLAVSDLDSMSETEGAELALKQNVWKPDFEKMVADGATARAAASVKIIYDRLAARPKVDTPAGRRQYVQMMQHVRDVYGAVKTEADFKAAKGNLLYDKLKWTQGSMGPDTGNNERAKANAQGIEDLGEHMKLAKAMLFSVYKGRTDPFYFDYQDDRKAAAMEREGFPAKGEPWKRRLAVRGQNGRHMTPAGVRIYTERSAEVGTPLTEDQLRGDFYEVRTVTGGKTLGYFTSKQDAEAAAKTLYERDFKGGKDEKPEPERPHLDELKREGLPQRIDRDVSAEDFVKHFGFRGIEFGNWSAQDERQRILNMAYDGLSDLAEIMGVPAKAMSLNGTLGMAFGARGGGRFAAHYEPGKLVINMTKIRGGGSMAHEWAHALDHYFGELEQPDAYKGRARGASGWYTEEQYNGVPIRRMERGEDGKLKTVERQRLANLRPELAAALDRVMSALFQAQITKPEMLRQLEESLAQTEALAASMDDPALKKVYQNSVANQKHNIEELKKEPDDKTFPRGKSQYLTEAQKLNGKSEKGYWTRPTEMFARAFESWVFDRVVAMGARSDYLVHGVEESRFAGGGYKGNPYPVGKERATIDAAFDQLAKTIQTKPTDKGVAMFRRSDGTEVRGDLTARAAAVQQLVDGITAKWANAPKVIVARDMQDEKIPQEVRDADEAQRSEGADEQVNGFHYRGKVYIVADAMTGPESVITTLAHESLGHFGLRGTFGDGLKPILQQIVAMRGKEVRAKAADYGLVVDKAAVRAELGKDATDADVQKVIHMRLMYAAEEVLAEMAAETPTLGFVKRAIAAIRTFLRDTLGLKLELTDDEIVRNFIIPAREFVVKGRATGKGRDEVSFHRTPWAEREDAPSRALRDVAIERFYDRLAETYDEGYSPDEAFDTAMEASSPKEQAVLRALKADDFLGFDYPHQALQAIQEEPEAYDISTPLKTALTKLSNDGAQFSRVGIDRRSFIMGTAAALAAKPAAADVTLGRAKPIAPAIMAQRLPKEVEKMLVGNGHGTTNLQGAKAIREALAIIVKSGPQEVRALAGEILKLMPTSGVSVQVDKGDYNVHGAVEFTPLVRLRLMDGKESHGMTYDTFLHESLHVAVAARYRSLSVAVLRENDAKLGMKAPAAAKAMEQFRAVWDEFKRSARLAMLKMEKSDLRLSLEEASGNPDEFFVRALTDPDLQAWMAKQEYDGKTLLQRFIDWIKRGLTIFNADTGTKASWLDAALLASDDLLKAMGGDPADFERLRAVERVNRRTSSVDTGGDVFASTAFSRTSASPNPATMGTVRAQIMQAMNDTFTAPGKLNWWHRTVGTQYNLAQRSPLYKRVFDGVQNFLNDVSLYATEAADLAPKILPKLETWRDIGKKPIAPEDNKAVSAPIFEGTLLWTRGEDGKPVKVDDLTKAADLLSVDAKASALLKGGHITEGVLKMWQGMKVDQYQQAVTTAYQNRILKPGIVWTDAELKSQFGLNAAQIGLYKEFRAAVDKSITNLAVSDMIRYAGKDAAAVRQMVLDAGDVGAASALLIQELEAQALEQPDRAEVLHDTAKKVFDKAKRARELMEEGYAPLSRFGHYTVDAIDENGERVFFGMFETARDAALAARKMKNNFPKAAITRGTVSEEEYKLFAGVTPETLELFGEMLGLEGSGSDQNSVAFQTYIKAAKANRSAMKRLIHRKGIAGFSEDVGRVLAGFVYSNARQTSQNLHMGEMTDAAAAITDPEKGGAKANGELKDQAVRLVEYVKNPQEEAQAFRGLLFAQYLGGSVASAMVNMLQPVQMTFPYLSQFGGAAKAAAALTRAYGDVRKKTTGDAALDAALKKAEEEGIVAPQEVHQLMAQAQGRGALKSGDGTTMGNARATTSNAFSRLSLAWGKIFSAAEQLNRRATFIAAWRTAVEQKMADPAAFAEKAIAETQGIYNKANKPNWARGAIGGTLFTFKQYSIAYVELLHRMATQGGPEGKKAALLMLGMLFLMSGAGGLPFAEDLEDVVDGVMQRLGYNFSSKLAKKAFFEKLLGKDLGRFAEHGISGLPGSPIDVAGRLGLGNLIPGTGLLVDKEDHTRDVTEFLGAGGDFATRLFKGANQLAQGDMFEAGKLVAPRAAANAAKALEMYTTGQYKDDRGRKVIDTDGFDALSKALGFQPAAVAQVQEATGMQQRLIAQAKAAEARFADRWAKAVVDADQDELRKVRQDIASYNAANREAPVTINRAQINKRIAAMREDKASRIARTAPREIRASVRDALETP